MRMIKRIGAIAVAALMLFSLAACAKTPERVLTDAVVKLSRQESMHYDMKMKMEIDMGLLSVNVGTAMKADLTRDPLRLSGVTSMNMGVLGDVEVPIYVGEEDGKYYTYVGSGTGTSLWVKSEIDETALGQDYDVSAMLEQYVEIAQSFTEIGMEKINGDDAVRYDGLISGDAIGTVLESTGVAEQLSSVGADDTALAEMCKELDGLTLSIWVDKKTDLPVKYYIDMTEMMKALGTLMGESSGVTSSVISFGTVTVEMTLSKFNGIEPIEIPQEALNASLTVNG